MMQLDQPGLLQLLRQHLGWYPQMQLEDVYKLIYQAVLGSEHLVSSAEQFSHYLELEFQHLQPDPHQQLFEPLRTDGSLLRLNLRPYKSRHLNSSALIHPFLMTAKLASGTRAELEATWQAFSQLCHPGKLAVFDTTGLHQFTQLLEQQGYPALHHSETYRRLYQPAYRLISASLIPQLELADAG
jgi:hypothetical protein